MLNMVPLFAMEPLLWKRLKFHRFAKAQRAFYNTERKTSPFPGLIKVTLEESALPNL
jgi:hypothetical protein